MSSIKIILLALLVTSCGTKPTDVEIIPITPPETTIPDKDYDEDLSKYVDEFILDAERFDIELPELHKLNSIVWGKTRTEDQPYRVGVCYKRTNDRTGALVYANIVIDKGFKDSFSLKALVYHELAHCVLLKDHEDKRTIMADTLQGSLYYEKCWEPLVEQLFLGGDIDCE